MRNISSYLLTALLLTPAIRSMAQEDINMATHWGNRTYYNPAFITRTDYLYLYTDVRRQWMGITGAPEVLNIQASQYFQFMSSALGISLVTDKIGITHTFNPMGTYAFRIAKKDNWTLSLGLSAGIFSRTVNGSLYEPDNMNDPSLSYITIKSSKPDANFGVEFQNVHFIYGFSSTHLFSIGKSDKSVLNSNHRYAYVIYKNDGPKVLSYSAGIQAINKFNSTILEGNISLRVKRKSREMEGTLLRGAQEIIDLGLTLRTSRQLTFNAGIMITSNIRVGYAYDQSLFSSYSRNMTHEIMLEYRIPSRAASPIYRCVNKEYWYH